MKEPKRIEVDSAELEQILYRSVMTEEDRSTMQAAIETLAFLTQQLEAKRVSVRRLQRIIFGARTEKTRNVVGSQPPASATGSGAANATGSTSRRRRKGHGRNGASAYHGAEHVPVPHASLHAGDACPECVAGKLYGLRNPKRIIRVTGVAPIMAKVYECEQLRCNTCGEVFTAEPPDGIGDEKYDATTALMIAVLKYGLGLPFYRLARLQKSIGVPLAPATQWQVMHAHIPGPEAVYDELVRQAAQAELVHNDDTNAKVLALFPSKQNQHHVPDEPKSKSQDRTGMFTSSIVAIKGTIRIALFFTGRQHAGENLADVLQHRAAGLGPPIHMCDALSRNLPKAFETILCNCLAHGRRGFVDVAGAFPDECRYVLETLRDVYRYDAIAREQNLSADQRLAWHQEHSAPLMGELENWMAEQINEKKVEPNSGLGEAIEYMQNHWHELTQFLRVSGAPLDNTIVERALKRAILHRKNALFFRTEHGAHVGDIFLSLIHTAELCGANPIDYLRALMANAKRVVACPSQWVPWNYQQALAVAA
jgi:hypothetical protein